MDSDVVSAHIHPITRPTMSAENDSVSPVRPRARRGRGGAPTRSSISPPTLIRIPTVNPPGECYADCAQLIGSAARRRAASTSSIHAAEGTARAHGAASPYQRRRHAPRPGRPAERAPERPLRRRAGRRRLDGRSVRRRRPRRSHLRPRRLRHEGGALPPRSMRPRRSAAPASSCAGSLEISGTVDEESGGFAGVAWLAETRPAVRRRASTASSSPSRSTSIASASAIAASTGSRSRRAAASATAACRFSASAPSSTWA